MTSTKYEGLFEDEVAELLRSVPERAYIVTGYKSYYQKKSGAIVEDGVTSANSGTMYNHYIDDKYVGMVSYDYIHSILCHREFTIEVY